MSTKSRQTIYGGRIMGAKIRAEGAREIARKAIREADRAEAEAWSIRMEGYGGLAQPSPTITGALECVIQAENLSSAERLLVPVRMEVVRRSILDAARDAVDMLIISEKASLS